MRTSVLRTIGLLWTLTTACIGDQPGGESLSGETGGTGGIEVTTGADDPDGSTSGTDPGATSSATDGSNETCVSQTCEEAGYACGPLPTCDGVLGCGRCDDNEVCDAATHTCVRKQAACDTAGAECGVLTDACGAGFVCGTCEPSSGLGCNGATLQCEMLPDDPGPEMPPADDAPGADSFECEISGYECGKAESLCSDTKIDCGECPEGMACGVNGAPNQCGPCLTACPPDAECGPVDDGCGGKIECGPCPGGEVCTDKGKKDVPSNVCCVPDTCEAASAECGRVDDGCGGKIDCGPCPTGEGCGAQGNDNVCEPCKTCESAQAECGMLDDGCGGEIYCGSCTDAGEGCGAQGNDNVCEPCKTCDTENAECGVASDGCGGTIQCGSCGPGETCSNEMECCAPKTCQEMGHVCGTPKDGCGGELDCGDCPNGSVCQDGGCCQPLTCAGLCNYTGPDGCGGVIQCGCGNPAG
jgi:hypothetical protein